MSPVDLDLKHQNVFLLEVNQPTNHVRLTVSNEKLKKNITNLYKFRVYPSSYPLAAYHGISKR